MLFFRIIWLVCCLYNFPLNPWKIYVPRATTKNILTPLIDWMTACPELCCKRSNSTVILRLPHAVHMNSMLVISNIYAVIKPQTPLLPLYFTSKLTLGGDMRGVQPLDGCQLLLWWWWRRCNERGGDLNVRSSLLATSDLFSKGKESGNSLCAWDKRNPRGLIKMSHPQRKHMKLTQRHRSVDDWV